MLLVKIGISLVGLCLQFYSVLCAEFPPDCIQSTIVTENLKRTGHITFQNAKDSKVPSLAMDTLQKLQTAAADSLLALHELRDPGVMSILTVHMIYREYLTKLPSIICLALNSADEVSALANAESQAKTEFAQYSMWTNTRFVKVEPSRKYLKLIAAQPNWPDVWKTIGTYVKNKFTDHSDSILTTLKNYGQVSSRVQSQLYGEEIDDVTRDLDDMLFDWGQEEMNYLNKMTAALGPIENVNLLNEYPRLRSDYVRKFMSFGRKAFSRIDKVFWRIMEPGRLVIDKFIYEVRRGWTPGNKSFIPHYMERFGRSEMLDAEDVLRHAEKYWNSLRPQDMDGGPKPSYSDSMKQLESQCRAAIDGLIKAFSARIIDTHGNLFAMSKEFIETNQMYDVNVQMWNDLQVNIRKILASYDLQRELFYAFDFKMKISRLDILPPLFVPATANVIATAAITDELARINKASEINMRQISSSVVLLAKIVKQFATANREGRQLLLRNARDTRTNWNAIISAEINGYYSQQLTLFEVISRKLQKRYSKTPADSSGDNRIQQQHKTDEYARQVNDCSLSEMERFVRKIIVELMTTQM